MFKIEANPTFRVTVKITRPGEATPGVMDVTYRHKTVQALADWWSVAKDKPVGIALAEIIQTIDGLTDAEGNAVAYNDAVLLKILQQFHTAGADLLQAYFAELAGAREKN